MLTASALVLLMTPGLSFFYGGMVGFKNVVSTMLQSVVALGVISLVWVARRLQPGVRRQHRRRDRQPADVLHVRRRRRARPIPTLAPTIPLLVFAMFQLKFAIITPALITGSFAERVRFSALPAVHGPVQPVRSTARWPTGPGTPTASCTSGACWTSPAARSSTCRPASRRWPGR